MERNHGLLKPKPSEASQLMAKAKIKDFLKLMGEDVYREGLLETPKRFVKFYDEFLNPPDFNFTTFKNEGNDEMIIVKDIPFYSLCEHHMAPFFGTGTIAYLPDKKIVGLSKLPRTLDMFARKLQNQERICTQVANFIQKQLKCKGVAVTLEARHMCMEMRGVKKSGSTTVTSCLLGAFKKAEVRTEYFNLIKK